MTYYGRLLLIKCIERGNDAVFCRIRLDLTDDCSLKWKEKGVPAAKVNRNKMVKRGEYNVSPFGLQTRQIEGGFW